MLPVNYKLYLVTDEACLKKKTLLEAVQEALEAGVTLVQYRAKAAPGKKLYQQAQALQQLCSKYQVPLIINDRLDIALAVGAAGVHLGQEDLPVQVVRRLVGPDFIIGATAHNVPEAQAAVAAGATYLGCGAVFATGTKKDTVPLGLEGLKAIRAAVACPLVGIAGITAATYGQVLATGAEGAAVVSAILGAVNITEAVQAFLQQA